MNAANPWLATVSRGTKKRSLVQFLFTELVPYGFLRLPAGSRVFFLLNTQFSFCFGFVALLFHCLAGMWWWPVRGYSRAGCAPAPISILGLERINQQGNAQRKGSVVLQIARISSLKSLLLHPCSVPLSSQGQWQLWLFSCSFGVCMELGAHLCPPHRTGHSPLLMWDWQLLGSPASPGALSIGQPRQKQGGHVHRGSNPLTHLPWLSVPPGDFLNFNFSLIFLILTFSFHPCSLCCFICHCHGKAGIPSRAHLRGLQGLEFHWVPFSPFHPYARLLRRVKIPVKWHVSKKHALTTLWGWLQNAFPHQSHLQHRNFTYFSLKDELRKLQCLSSELYS